ncbi:MAG: hypothetical protein JWQ56_1370 [Pseudarthrobacter sp.]|nr:hypothetical protein [Pseudarthrobacter sp.]
MPRRVPRPERQHREYHASKAAIFVMATAVAARSGMFVKGSAFSFAELEVTLCF